MADNNLIELIKVLRERTGAGLMDCKGALLANDLDVDKACDWLREKGLAKAAKKAERIAAEGLAITKTCESCGKTVILEVNCETDFVAKSDAFKSFVDEIASRILSKNLKDVASATEACEDLFSEATVKMGEKFSLRRFEVADKKSEEGIGTYIHMGGKIAVVVVLEKANPELEKQLAMHIAANNPQYINMSDVPADVLEHERNVQIEAAKNDEKLKSKPLPVLEKIVDGKVHKTFQEMTLSEQPFLMDDSKTIAQVLTEKNNRVLRFIRYQVGEGIEKRKDDFASEVMKEIGK